ncbi:TPA: restriction endonuclease subunit S [Enterococcus faecium]|uniref:Type I restriction modification DNA specificity domain-containing protein n=2 Tax=Enterococcus TaxID=1350 RepID=A0A2S7M7M5_ENTFC|nr:MULTISPECIES: restriction endonuclease subunit S [Enterococcus]EGO9937472.1 restriction endonuclease subunit S [Enterococcus faecium]EGP4922643.1 restriction endonuclease subunit S [Enterococcus faecium]EGP4955574.1 restriction endonuclease subunit S [Enterococcus faecium]EGP5328335.1 restriction endonuclease subunit S [Enterococcus faecium]EGP5433018.1 restriction endonuclease subunit S [Enterococcus faecium]
MSFSEWREVALKDVIEFNPKESIKKGTITKKIGMDKLAPFQRKIDGFELEAFKGGSKFRNGDTLLARITPCLENGKTAQVTILDDDEVAFGSTEYIVLRHKIGITDNNYIFYLALSQYVRDTAIKSMTGTSGRQRAQTDVIENTKIMLPPLDEQKAIAHILSTLDDKIEVNNQINKTLENMAQAIFKQWFVDFEFPNEDGEPYKSSGGEMVESELGMIPKGWEVKELVDVLETLEAGNRPKGGAGNLTEGIPSIGAENIIGLGKYDYSKEKYVTEEYFAKMNKGKVNPGDVLLYKDGAQLGRKTMFMNGFPHKKCCINSHVFILRTNDMLTQSYLYFWLDQDWVTQSIINLNANSAQPGINQSKLKTLKILTPKFNYVEMFDVIIKSLLNKLFENCIENNALHKTRDALLPKLMSGEIRVPLDEEGDVS